MRKLLSIMLSVIFLTGALFSVVSCMKIDEETKWYSEKSLITTGLENLPKPDFEYKGYDGMEYSIDGIIFENGFIHTRNNYSII